MACFLVPTAEAVVTTIVTKSMKSKEEASSVATIGPETSSVSAQSTHPLLHKLKWLTNMLWGGSVLLAFEHVWHGEVIPVFPFLTAASNPADAAVMLQEMATVGVSMAALITVVWGVMVAVTGAMEKKATTMQPSAN